MCDRLCGIILLFICCLFFTWTKTPAFVPYAGTRLSAGGTRGKQKLVPACRGLRASRERFGCKLKVSHSVISGIIGVLKGPHESRGGKVCLCLDC